jgi:hypothetical protein
MKLTTKQTTEHTVDINIPFFRKRRYTESSLEYFGMVVDGFTLEVYESDDRVSVCSNPKWIKEGDIVDAYCNWEPISESAFIEAYQKTLNYLSLVPTLVDEPAAHPDDLKEVNI